MSEETTQKPCIEKYPASDGLDPCIYVGTHILHGDELGRTWSTEMVTTISQEQPTPHGEGSPVEKESLSMDTNKDTAQCKSLSMPPNERCRNEEGHQGSHRSIQGTEWRIITKTDEEIDLVSNVRELVRDHALLSLKYSEATSELMHNLEDAIRSQKAEITRLSEEQIKPLADYLMHESDKIGHPGPDEGACAMAIRVIGELMDDD